MYTIRCASSVWHIINRSEKTFRRNVDWKPARFASTISKVKMTWTPEARWFRLMYKLSVYNVCWHFLLSHLLPLSPIWETTTIVFQTKAEIKSNIKYQYLPIRLYQWFTSLKDIVYINAVVLSRSFENIYLNGLCSCISLWCGLSNFKALNRDSIPQTDLRSYNSTDICLAITWVANCLVYVYK